MAKPRIEIELTTKGVKQVQQALDGLVSGVHGWALRIGGAIAGALGVQQIVSSLKGAVEQMDKVGATSQRVGLATTELSRLEYAASISKASVEELHTALRFLARNTFEAVSGQQSAIDTFTDAGVAYQDNAGRARGLGDILRDLADRFAAMPNGAEKAALSLQLFGKQGTSMIPLLNQGSAEIAKLAEEARALGVDVTPQAAQAAGDFNDNLERLQFAAKGLWLRVAQELLPTLVELTNRMVAWVKSSDAVRIGAELIAEALRMILFDAHALIVAVRVLAKTFEAYIDGVAKGITAFGRLIARVWEGPIEIVRAFIEHMKVAVRAVGDLAQALVLVAQGRFTEAKDKAKAAGAEIVGAMATAATAVAESMGKSGDAIRDAFVTPFEGGAETFRTFIEEGKKGVDELARSYQAIWGRAPTTTSQARKPALDFDGEDPAALRRKQARIELDRAGNALADKRLQLETEISRIEFDRQLSDTERYRRTLELKREEVALQAQYIADLKERAQIEQDQQTQAMMYEELRKAERQQTQLETGLGRFQAQGDPASMVDQLYIAADDMARRIGTLAQQVARSFTDIIGSAIDSVSDAITGVIKGTLTWRDALQSVAETIGNTILNAIVRMFVEWIAKRALLAVKNILFAQQEGAAETAAKTPGAVLTSISSYGIAAVVGVAAVMAALAAAGAFAEGGPVQGPGGPKSDSIMARLSAGEYVLNAEAVRFYGQPMLDAMNRRLLEVSPVPQEAGASGVAGAMPEAPKQATPSGLNLVLVDRRNQAREFIESFDGEAKIVEVVRRRRLEIGIRG